MIDGIDFDNFTPEGIRTKKPMFNFGIKKKMMIIGIIYTLYTAIGTIAIIYTIIDLIK
jgi:hypothetical protein